jgi:hypothetical protein
MYGWLEDLGKAAVNGLATQAELLGDVATGNYKDIVQAIIGSNSNGTAPGDLVEQIQQGPGTSTLQRARDIGTAQSGEQLEIEQQSRQMATDLESAWTGKSSDAALAEIQPLADTARSASEALASNSSIVQDQIDQFHSLKDSMHTDVTNEAPEKNLWDKATPWDTSTEDAINQRNQKVQENLAIYNTYAQQTDANKPAMTTDYGQLGQQQDGTFKVENKPLTPPPTPPYPPSVYPTTNNPTNPRIPSQSKTQVPTIPQLPGDIRTGNPPGSTQQSIPTPTYASYDQTQTSGYTPPGTANTNYPGYQPGGFGPGGGSGGSGSGGFGSGGFGGGFGPGGGGGFGPGGSGSSSGSSSSGGLSGGRGSGAGLPGGSAGQSGVKAGAAGAASAGRPGQSGMGGGQKGQGGEDAEHERASYLIEADPESIFGSDARATPPVIGE